MNSVLRNDVSQGPRRTSPVGVAARATASGVPSATTRPPSSPDPGSEIDDPVGGEHDCRTMRDHHDGMASVNQRAEGFEQLEDIDGMEPGGRLVEEEQGMGCMHGRVGARPATGP